MLNSFTRKGEEDFILHNIHEGIDSTLILLGNKIKNKVTIHKQYGEFPEVECQPERLNQVFMNILSNAIDAIRGEGIITLCTGKSAGKISISIRDNGKGMSEGVRAKIFDPFYTTKEVGSGTGLGLSISHGIIKKHKGNIKVISKPGEGSEFIISLPLIQGK